MKRLAIPRSLRNSRCRFSTGFGIATGPRDTASDRDPVRPPLCLRWPRSEGSLALFAAPATSKLYHRTSADKNAVSEKARDRPTPRRMPLDPPPSAPHTEAGRAASRRRCGAAFRTNCQEPPRSFTSKASQW